MAMIFFMVLSLTDCQMKNKSRTKLNQIKANAVTSLSRLPLTVRVFMKLGAFVAQMFIPPLKFNSSTKAECLVVSPNLINTLLAVFAVNEDKF